MEPNTTRYAMDKKTGRQLMIVSLFLLPLVLFSLSAFTFTPNTSQSIAMGTTLPHSVTDVSCSDVITLEQFDESGIRIYFNACALEHLTAIVSSASAVGAGVGAMGLVSLLCPECDPLIPWISAIALGATAGINFLQYASQGCGGAILDISWEGGIQFESACSPPNTGP
jgi:hypothetical protein